MAELNFNAQLYHPMQPEDVVDDYDAWLAVCRRMDQEAAEARLAWRTAIAERDRIHNELKAKADELRLHCLKLEARQKPTQPRKS